MEDLSNIKLKDITLGFLTNPLYHNIMNLKSEELLNNNNSNTHKEDIKFYRKRISALSKQFLKEESSNTALKKIHDDYVNAAISYLKMIDTKDIIQEQYNCEDLSNNVLDISDNDISLNDIMVNESNIAEANQQMMRKIINISNLDNYIIKKVQENDCIIPLKKEINLYTPELKIKGILKKNKKIT